MKEKIDKKIIVPTIIAVVTLVLLVFGATYAYFTVGSTNNFGTKDLSATVEDMAGSVVLEQVQNTLSLDITRAQMSQDNAGTTYYASGSSTPANIAKISTVGEGTFTCTYKINVTKSSSKEENDLETAFQSIMGKNSNHIYLSINEKKYDFYDLKTGCEDVCVDENECVEMKEVCSGSMFPITYNGTISGVSKDSPQYITTNLAIYNDHLNTQNELKGKDITLTFNISDFDCKLNERTYSNDPIFAIFVQNEDWEGHGSLIFYQNNDVVNVGDTYDGYKVTEVYTNLNNTNYTSVEDVPWNNETNNVANVIFEETVSPTNTAYWFAYLNNGMYLGFENIENLDTSKVTDMSYMFAGASSEDTFSLNLESFDTSNVTNMESMFEFAGAWMGFYADISTWDTSKVTNMSSMFASAASCNGGEFNVDLSAWDTSNVTDMSYMFYNTTSYGFSVGNITRREVTSNGKTYIAWDTSKVTDMSYMFYNAGGEYSEYILNLTSWQVPLVTNYNNFNVGVESKITTPTWVD